MQHVTGVDEVIVASRGLDKVAPPRHTTAPSQRHTSAQPEHPATNALVEQVVFEQVTSLRTITFGLVDDLRSHTNGASLGATVALTHLQDIANKLGVVESLLSAPADLGRVTAA